MSRAIAAKTPPNKSARGIAAKTPRKKTARAAVAKTPGDAAARAVILLSGGLDSATCLLIARGEGHDVFALSFDYGQRHRQELDRARALASRYGAAAHRIERLDFPGEGASALTDAAIAVPHDRLGAEPIPATYVPARNTLFLAHAVAWAEVLGAREVFIGANALDYSGYPDCRGEFLRAFESAVNLGTRAGSEGRRFRIRAPLLEMSKAEIIRTAAEHRLDFSLTSSCYEPGVDGRPCGSCDACLLRAKGFEEAGLPDPLVDI
jgi:7-cyano-7-deazaguanine synthase